MRDEPEISGPCGEMLWVPFVWISDFDACGHRGEAPAAWFVEQAESSL
jgi:hypothetical protein